MKTTLSPILLLFCRLMARILVFGFENLSIPAKLTPHSGIPQLCGGIAPPPLVINKISTESELSHERTVHQLNNKTTVKLHSHRLIGQYGTQPAFGFFQAHAFSAGIIFDLVFLNAAQSEINRCRMCNV